MDDPTSTSTFEKTQALTHEAISRRAQELWERYGRPSGRDEEIWFEAERELRNNAVKTQPVPATPPRPDDGNVAPGAKPVSAPTASTPTAISSSPKAPRAGGKRKSGGSAR